ncbi:MAG: DsbC family protein [Candidatus Eutrophobiaceae bacterium]
MKNLQIFSGVAGVCLSLFCSLAQGEEPMAMDTQAIQDSVGVMAPGVEPSSINPTPIAGLYEVVIGMDVVYFSADGRYAIKGNLYDLGNRSNLTNAVKSDLRAGMLGKLTSQDYIEFSPSKVKDIVYIFTDIDCGYCRKLHSDIDQYHKYGIAIRYIAYPRHGPFTATAQRMQDVWCAKDPQKALTLAKQGSKVAKAQCAKNKIEEQYNLGAMFDIGGTPAMFLPDGQELKGGYKPAAQLADDLDKIR